MSNPHDSNGAGGPFNARHIRCALRQLGFELLAASEADDEADVYLHPDGGMVPLDPKMTNVYYGDRWFINSADAMVAGGLAGSTRRRAVEERMLLLRSHLLACRDGDNDA